MNANRQAYDDPAVMQALTDRFIEILGTENVLTDTPMKGHTSFKIGGPARLMALPSTTEEVEALIKACREYDSAFYVMGNGSNILVNSDGIRRPVIKIADRMSQVSITGTEVVAQAGVLLSALSSQVVAQSLAGFEFGSGIPGTLGGAVCMNAGAYGGEMKDVVTSVTVLDETGTVRTVKGADMDFGYRHSEVMTHGWVVLDATMSLKQGDMETIKETIADLTYKRTSKQPLHLPSAGSTFKRPVGHFAGQLIEEAGLKGLRHRGAQVSEKHSGFIVNVDNATYEDVINLIRTVQKVVRDRFDVELEPEVRILEEGF